jgi:hypothetical protein
MKLDSTDAARQPANLLTPRSGGQLAAFIKDLFHRALDGCLTPASSPGTRPATQILAPAGGTKPTRSDALAACRKIAESPARENRSRLTRAKHVKMRQKTAKIDQKTPSFRTFCRVPAGALASFAMAATRVFCELIPVCAVCRLLTGDFAPLFYGYNPA